MTERIDGGGTAGRSGPAPQQWVHDRWTALGRGWQAVVLGLAIVGAQLLLQSL